MTKKRFHKGYCCGDTGLIDEEGEWFIENINSVSDLKKNWDTVIDKLNELNKENKNILSLAHNQYEDHKRIVNNYVDKIKQLEIKNKELKEQLLCATPLFSRRELENENQLLKQALKEMLENSGNKYLIDLFDKIFDLNYYEWEKKMNDSHTYDYVEWEEVLKKRGQRHE